MRQFDQAAVTAFLREAATSDDRRLELTAPDGSRLVFERGPAPGVEELLTEVGPDGTARVHAGLSARHRRRRPATRKARRSCPGAR